MLGYVWGCLLAFPVAVEPQDDVIRTGPNCAKVPAKRTCTANVYSAHVHVRGVPFAGLLAGTQHAGSAGECRGKYVSA